MAGEQAKAGETEFRAEQVVLHHSADHKVATESEVLLPWRKRHGINNPRGSPRLPREATAETSRPRTQTGGWTPCLQQRPAQLSKSRGLSAAIIGWQVVGFRAAL